MRNLALAAIFAAALLAVQAPGAVAAPSAGACAPRIEQGWLRLPPAAMPMLAGFARIANPCAAEMTVVSASSDAFASVELHQSRIVDGVSRMRPVPALRIPAGGAVDLAPGGLHLMLMKPASALEAGDTVELRLRLDDAREIRGRFEVRSSTPR